MKKFKNLKVNKYRLLSLLAITLILIGGNIAYTITFGERTIDYESDPDYISSRVSGNKVYVNDLVSDYDYYMGLNYTTNDGHIPTKENKNIYNENNLVEVKITYSSHDASGLIGYVSLTERQDTYIYFKTYPVNNNNTPNDLTDDYIDIELIDNPFTDRPSNQGFNGWITSYQGAHISYDNNYYERHLKVPVDYTDNLPNKIDITLNASWVDATVYLTNGSITNINNNIKRRAMEKIETIITKYEYNMLGYYKQHTVSNRQTLNGYYSSTGTRYGTNDRCSFWNNDWNGSGCSVYERITTNENFNANEEYYELVNNRMQLVTADDLGITPTIEVSTKYNNSNMSGYYENITLNYGTSQTDYYDNEGNKLTGSCNSYNGCSVYKLIQYYDEQGNPNTFNENNEYYYLVTRDTNIVVINSNVSGAFSNNQNYPFTITGINDGTNYNATWTLGTGTGNAINCYDDVTIENILLRYNGNVSTTQAVNPPTNTTTAGTLYARFNNVKIGRNITTTGSYFTLRSIVGGNNSTSGSNNNPTKNKIIIESGKYASISIANGAQTGTGGNNLYLNNKAVYGSDYDRANSDNSKLNVTYCASGSWSGRVYATTNSTTSSDISFDLTVKSGEFGTGKIDLTTGIYVGGRYGGTQYAVRQIKVEGGYIYNLIGGPISASNRSEYNDIYIYMTGGEVDMITGGAGTSATYGNRIIQITGGKVNYSVFGGSNGQDGTSGDGTLNGSTYLYIGGTSTIGDETLVNNNSTLWGSESGSIFGNGNGNTTTSSIGSCDNSTIIIDGNALINKNVYGGGNYGATGISSTNNTSSTTIVINGGIIKGDVYGGGNRNGAGSTSKTGNINIEVNNGVIAGSLYGGSNLEGTIYGSVDIKMTGGEISNSLYGGGKGGKDSSNNGTYVRDAINITVGDDTSIYTPIINNSIYGGSAFGTVNGTTNSTNVSTNDTHITVNKGIITNVYGGGEGNDTYTPYVLGNINVTINNGNITNVFGGNDKKGTPNGIIEVYINGGAISSTYGGGNETSANETNVYLNGGTSTKIFGGSNLSGDVNTSHITTTGGYSSVVYGGNNQGGTTGTTNVLINGGTIGTVYGGGDATSVSTSTNVIVNSDVSTIFGGSNLSGNIPISNITVNNANTTNIYGGNNEGGITSTSNISIFGGYQENVYGGGLKAETNTTNINANYGFINNLYGGGSEAGANTTNINLASAFINNAFGGSNISGNVNNSYIKNITNSTNNSVDITASYSESSQHNPSATNYKSSQEITVNIKNTGPNTITTWDLFLITSEGFLGNNWSSSKVEEINNGYHIDETNQYYGTNQISGGNSHQFSFHIHSQVPYEDFQIYGYSFVGFDANGNKYTNNLQINNLYGGNNEGGITTNTHIDLTDGVINYLYGGGNKAKTTNTNISLENTKITNSIFGGGNEASVDDVIMNISSSTIGTSSKEGTIFGGGNKAAINNTIKMQIDTNTTVNGSVYGGGNLGEVLGLIDTSIINSTITSSIYGGGNQAPVGAENNEDKALTLTITNTTANNIYGAGNQAPVYGNIILTVNEQSKITDSIYGGGNLGSVFGTTNTTIDNSIITNNIYGAGNQASVGKNITENVANLIITTSTAKNIYGGGNAAPTNGNTNTKVSSSTITSSIYGGGNGTDSIVPGDETGEQNLAKVLGDAILVVDTNTTAENIYGGGNLGMVNGSTNVESTGITVSDSIYGGGNAAIVGANTYLLVSSTTVNNSVYAGGNGASAIVKGNTNLDIDNASQITNHVFGGGNAAATGQKDINNSTGVVNIAGATIGKNVYGGANTSVLYGITTVNIGKSAITNNSLIPTNITIGGTVFGGGEANASGSEVYDFTFISVTKGININIDAKEHEIFKIDGSIFGSGNASSTSGYSYININNYGTLTDIKRNISIQRANIVSINNSYISLSGATDRTNEYSNVLFTLSRIDELKLKNSSSLYLEKGANLVKKFNSVVDINGTEEKATVTIDNENNTIERNVNNRVYMLEGENLNIAKNESVTEYGDVSGMTFFGMYRLDRNNNIITALYSDYAYGATAPSGDIYYFTDGSYVLGKHLTNHDITKDGFYSNYGSEDGNSIIIKYIEPTPADSAFYMWSIGEVVASYEVSLTASKYSTLGTLEVPLLNHATPNTTFSILGVNFSELDPEITLVDYKDIPRVAATGALADTVFGLNMKSGQTGWLNNGSTNFISVGENNITGTKDYIRENFNNVPALVFYLYHSKNLTTSGSMGSVTISLVAITPIDDLNNEVERININIDLSRALYNTNDYEGTITSGKKYEMFATSSVDITTKSSFSTYYSLYMNQETNPYKTGYYRSLVSSFALPVNTKITMIDFHNKTNPVYYYYVINEEDYNNSLIEFNAYGETSYKLSKFVKMGSTSLDNNYSDTLANNTYYSNNIAEEEFIFIVDFKDSEITTDKLDETLLIELRNADDQTLISVLGIEQQTLKYNLYTNSDSTIELEGTVSKNPVYLGNSTTLTIDTNFVSQEHTSTTIYDTTFDNEKLGIKISIYDSHNNLLSAQDLLGANFTYNGNTYYPRYDGTTRIKISDKVANARSKIIFNTGTSKLSTDEYTILIESFGSYDGIYYGPVSREKIEIPLKIIASPYGLSIGTNDKMIFVDKETGFTINNNNIYSFKINYESELTNANLRLKLQRRDYSSIYSNIYNEVDLLDYVQDTYEKTNNNYEYILSTTPVSNITYSLHFKENLMTGTYRLVVNLYDGDDYIGDIYHYIIIK